MIVATARINRMTLNCAVAKSFLMLSFIMYLLPRGYNLDFNLSLLPSYYFLILYKT